MSDHKEQVNSLREHADLIETSGIELYGPSATRLLVYDLRNAAAAIEELQQIANHHEQTAKDYWKEACEYKAQLPKRGKWIFDGKFVELHKFHCSNCKRTEFRMSDYCPNCGADMREMEVNNG